MDPPSANAETTPYEPVLCPGDLARYSLFPIQHHNVFDIYKQMYQSFWTVDELDLSADKQQYARLSIKEQNYIKFTLAFFANSDNAVLENLSKRLTREITMPEAVMALMFQAAMETIHAHGYNLMIDGLIESEQEKRELFHAVETNPVIQPKFNWTLTWIQSQDTLATRLMVWCAVESVFFSSSFASLFWLRKQGLLPGICFANELIARDEYLHVQLSAALYKLCRHKRSESDVHALFAQAVTLEHAFVDSILPEDLRGINAAGMKQYVCFVADTTLLLLGYTPLFSVSNPFPWMEGMGILSKANFFEKRVSEYARPDAPTLVSTRIEQELDF